MIQIKNYWFPHPETSDQQGLLAIGGDLTPDRILQAYSQGIFPWYEPGCPVLWWSPHPRSILYPDEFKLTPSLRKSLKKSFKFSVDTAFTETITACATVSNRENNTWITAEMKEAYTTLYEMGFAHSFEIWQQQKLVGGLYGISLGNAFFGESMFHLVPDASKIALYYLCQTMKAWDFHFIDCQMPTPHLLRMGAKIISRSQFLHILMLSLKHPNKQKRWSIDSVI